MPKVQGDGRGVVRGRIASKYAAAVCAWHYSSRLESTDFSKLACWTRTDLEPYRNSLPPPISNLECALLFSQHMSMVLENLQYHCMYKALFIHISHNQIASITMTKMVEHLSGPVIQTGGRTQWLSILKNGVLSPLVRAYSASRNLR